MKMKAIDSFYSSETKQVHAGQEFEIGDAAGHELEKRGLAKQVETASTANDPKAGEAERVRLDDPEAAEKLSAKAQAAHPNKAASDPPNKADAKPKSKGDK